MSKNDFINYSNTIEYIQSYFHLNEIQKDLKSLTNLSFNFLYQYTYIETDKYLTLTHHLK